MTMAIFGKKKTTPCCGGDRDNKSCCERTQAASSCCSGATAQTGCCGQEPCGDSATARFIVLGACCQKSTDTFNNVKQAVREMGFADEVLNIGDALEIARYGVMQTPAFVVDNRVVSCGRLLKVDDVKKILSKLGVK